MKINKIFNKNKNIIIGAIHFPPLLGYKNFPGFDIALNNALQDLKALEAGGVDAIIFENNYDIPHKIFVNPSIISSMTYLGEKIKNSTKLPVGVSVLWNDYRSALSIAKILDLQFIRIPVFVDKVKTSYGIVEAIPKEIIVFRKSIKADNIAIFTDIHVKHAEILSQYTLSESAKLAIVHNSDALIVTGRWTGDAPDINEITSLKKHIGTFPIIIGSGIDKNNAKTLLNIANGAIISTSFKEGDKNYSEINIKPYTRRIDCNKVKELIETIA